jgi:hypothetical protein
MRRKTLKRRRDPGLWDGIVMIFNANVLKWVIVVRLLW